MTTPATQAVQQYYSDLREFVQSVLLKGVDYSGDTFGKPVLLKPGAEKVYQFLRYHIEDLTFNLTDVDSIVNPGDLSKGIEPLFMYRRRCTLYSGGTPIGSAEGSCNSREIKYRYRKSLTEPEFYIDKVTFKAREAAFAVDKSETDPSSKYAKPQSYWDDFHEAIANGTAKKVKVKFGKGKEFDGWEIETTTYRTYNQDVWEQLNTVLKMADKRAFVAAVLLVAGLSEFFTQDLEDMDSSAISDGGSSAQAQSQPSGTIAPAPKKRTSKAQTFKNRGDAITWAMQQDIFKSGIDCANALSELIESDGIDMPEASAKWQEFVLSLQSA